MTPIMLDTDTVSHVLRGALAPRRRLAALDRSEWCISAITRAELRHGLASKPEATRLAALVEGFLETARCIAWDAAAADQYGALRGELAAGRNSIGHMDEMIAAHALAVGAVLVTGKTRHFGRVPGLRIEDWLVREPRS